MKRAALLVYAAALAVAHPLGNASVSHYARLTPSGDGVSLVYALDLAEVPSFELLQEWGLEPRVSSVAEIEAKAREQARRWVEALRLMSMGRAVKARFEGAETVAGEGAGGLLVLRITARAFVPAAGELDYEDPNYEGRAGWKEIVIPPARDLSKALTEYPDDPLLAPPQTLRASMKWTVEKPEVPAPAAEAAPVVDTPPAPPPPSAPASPRPATPGVSKWAFPVLIVFAAFVVFLWRKLSRRL